MNHLNNYNTRCSTWYFCQVLGFRILRETCTHINFKYHKNRVDIIGAQYICEFLHLALNSSYHLSSIRFTYSPFF